MLGTDISSVLAIVHWARWRKHITTTRKGERPQEFFHGDGTLFPQGMKEVFGDQNLTRASSAWDGTKNANNV